MNVLTSARPLLRPSRLATATRAFSTTQRAQLARMQLLGRLATAPEIRPTSTGTELIRYVVASDYGPRDNRQTSFFSVAAFLEDGPRKQHLMSLPKGTLVHLDADAQMNTYEDPDTNKKRSTLNLIHRMCSWIDGGAVSGLAKANAMLGSIEVIRRPVAPPTDNQNISAAEHPDGGLGAS